MGSEDSRINDQVVPVLIAIFAGFFIGGVCGCAAERQVSNQLHFTDGRWSAKQIHCVRRSETLREWDCQDASTYTKSLLGGKAQ